MLDQTIIIHIASIIEQWCTLTRRQRRANSVKGGLFQNYAKQLYFFVGELSENNRFKPKSG
ncbi:hypothetical protein BML2537_25110 [Providencia stuartii]|nr:hypothetical protein BML2537_25110 [Providencia stuartii]